MLACQDVKHYCRAGLCSRLRHPAFKWLRNGLLVEVDHVLADQSVEDIVIKPDKDDDDDKNKRQSSSKGKPFADDSEPVENHRCAAAPRERQETVRRNFALVRAAYEKATGKRGNKSDAEAYNENGIEKLPVDKVISALEAVVRRTPAKINSFNYFVKEIV